MVERRITERVSILSADNDAVVIDIDAESHLPRRRTFETRNKQFKDIDEDAEEYDDYHTIQGLPSAFTITRYHNGDMTTQTFFSKIGYNVDLSPDTFNPNVLLNKKEEKIVNSPLDIQRRSHSDEAQVRRYSGHNWQHSYSPH